MNPPSELVAHWGVVTAACRLGQRAGGFSGARIWRADFAGQAYCLRLWPAGTARAYLTLAQRLLDRAQAAQLAFVPRLIPTPRNEPFVQVDGRFVELTTWATGTADFWRRPSPARLEAACRALARLHLAWENHQPSRGPCPAAARRLVAWREWTSLRNSGWRPRLDDADPVAPWARRALIELARWMPQVPQMLAEWETPELPLHPCLCDIWHDHVLYTGDEVTGIVDYGSVKWDHASADLARLLGSLVGDDGSLQELGLGAYRSIRPLDVQTEGLVQALDRTGTILGAANWLRWLYHERRDYADRQAVAARLRRLVERIEGWKLEIV